MKNIIATITLICVLAGVVKSQQLYFSLEPYTGKKDIVSIDIPQGWLQTDNENVGVAAHQLFTKVGETLEHNKGFVFIQTIATDETFKTPEAIVEQELMMLKSQSVKLDVLSKIHSDKKKVQAEIISIKGSADGDMLMAFIPVKKAVIVITLCASETDYIISNTVDFVSMVKSYQINPIINPPSFADLVIW